MDHNARAKHAETAPSRQQKQRQPEERAPLGRIPEEHFFDELPKHSWLESIILTLA